MLLGCREFVPGRQCSSPSRKKRIYEWRGLGFSSQGGGEDGCATFGFGDTEGFKNFRPPHLAVHALKDCRSKP